MKPALFTPAAEADVEEAYQWYEGQRAGLGEAFGTPSTWRLPHSKATLRPILSYTGTRGASCCRGFLTVFTTAT